MVMMNEEEIVNMMVLVWYEPVVGSVKNIVSNNLSGSMCYVSFVHESIELNEVLKQMEMCGSV
jgi:hypothetical protein